MNSWFKIKAKAGGASVLDVSIHDEIGIWGISAAEFIRELQSHKEAQVINLSVHSPGGNLLDGLAMYNSLLTHPATVNGTVEGIAASAASLVLMAADNIAVPEDVFVMIHNPWGFAIGDAEELRDTADIMEKMQNTSINIYQKRTGKDWDEIEEMMRGETWMTAAEALEHGFVDSITEPLNVAAKVCAFTKYFKAMPVQNSLAVEKIHSKRDYEKFLRDSGLPRGLATSLTSRAADVFQSDSEGKNDGELAQLSERLEKLRI